MFYVSSAAFGVCITQAGLLKTYLEVFFLLVAAVAVVTCILVTFLSILFSARAFDSRRIDLDKEQQTPYKASEQTVKIESALDLFNRLQMIFFGLSLVLLLLFGGARLIEAICPAWLAIASQTTKSGQSSVSAIEPIKQTRLYNSESEQQYRDELSEMSKKKENQSVVIDDKKGVKPKPPPPRPPQKPKETKSK